MLKIGGEIPYFIVVTCFIWKVSPFNGPPVLLNKSFPVPSIPGLIVGGKLNLCCPTVYPTALNKTVFILSQHGQ